MIALLDAKEIDMGMDEYNCDWQQTERDKQLHELATRYHTECETYDRTICTGLVRDGGIMPATSHELILINRNASAVRKKLNEEAVLSRITPEELGFAIRKWRGSAPNNKIDPRR